MTLLVGVILSNFLLHFAEERHWTLPFSLHTSLAHFLDFFGLIRHFDVNQIFVDVGVGIRYFSPGLLYGQIQLADCCMSNLDDFRHGMPRFERNQKRQLCVGAKKASVWLN